MFQALVTKVQKLSKIGKMTVSDFAAKNPTRSDDSEVSTKFWLKGFVLSVDVLLGSVVVFFLLANLIKRKTRSVETLRRLDSN